METLTSLDICQRLFDKIGVFVSPAFDHAPNEFKALYRNRVQDFPGGFRRIDLVPKVLMIKRIAKDSSVYPDVALLILRNWFLAKPELHSSAAGFLEALGYEIFEPDFERNSITHNSLKPEHIRTEDNAYYFTSGDDAPFDKLELTVMVALLGWFPETGGEEESAGKAKSEH